MEEETGTKHFHKMYGGEKPRIAYQKKDFIDYVLMILITAIAVVGSYGPNHIMTRIGLVLCVFMIVAYPVRNGLKFEIPVLLRRPQDFLYMIIYRVQNLKGSFFVALAVLALENYLIYLTPGLPHKVALMREVAFYLFYISFVLIMAYRTAIFISHMRKRELVREFLMQTSWKGLLSRQPNMTLEVVHAYLTGVLTHVLLIAPWWVVIYYCNFSIVFFPAVFAINIFTHIKAYQRLNEWFYRDHWLCHNSEFEFLYLHGSHHDAIPSGLIGVAGNGYLEGFLRYVLGQPIPFYTPFVAFLITSAMIKSDIDGHQFIPGVYPNMPTAFQEINQHSTHHFGHLEPYSFGLKLNQPNVPLKIAKLFQMVPDEIKNGVRLDERLTGFKWENPRFKAYLNLYDKYQK